MSLDDRMTEKLDSFDSEIRRAALQELARKSATAKHADLPSDSLNLHMHTFYSFNAENYSPSRLAWESKSAGLAFAGIVDFDVLDGVEEFLEAGRLLNLRTCAGIESRVFVPEFADAVINSPGEPGIAYHMGAGIPQRTVAPAEETFLANLKKTASQRTRELVDRVNPHLAPVTLDYDADVLPHTPNNNATERHVCKAYALKAAEQFPETTDLVAYWTEKLDTDVNATDLPDQPALLNLIRAKTMKKGGVGYVQADAKSFPLMQEMNAFVREAGGIPCLAWLDGQSEGEQRMEELLDVAMNSGVSAVNIIPDRNYTPGVKDQKLANLQAMIALAESRDLPVLVGTEMNAPGQKFVDDFASAELAPYVPLFLRSARIIYAHTLLQRYHEKGYLSDWAREHFPNRKARNDYFAEKGRTVQPGRPEEISPTLN